LNVDVGLKSSDGRWSRVEQAKKGKKEKGERVVKMKADSGNRRKRLQLPLRALE
jgi:hypothetical protein